MLLYDQNQIVKYSRMEEDAMNIFGWYTLRSLKQNRTRTIVTIIGIILSTAMITAVTTTVSSIQNFLLEAAAESDGSWHVNMLTESRETVQEVEKAEGVVKSAGYADITYAKPEGIQSERTPYLYIGGFSGDFEELLTLRIKEGRMPERSNELIVPVNMAERSGIQYKIGEKVTLETGLRREEESGETVWQDYLISPEKGETFVSGGRQTYEIVGTYESARLGYWEPSLGEPGYTALTRLDDSVVVNGRRMVYAALSDAGMAEDFAGKLMKRYGKESVDLNYFYLRMQGSTLNERTKGMLAGFMLVLIGIIMFGSVALIGNSFAISLNERKKQYGLLSSVGATRKQLRQSVLFEAVVLSGIGIPLGILAGIGGMAVTFYCLRGTFSQFANMGDLSIHMSAALWAVVLAAGVGVVTVLISAYLPVRKALKISPIDAVRQTTDIVARPVRLKTARLTERLFGLEGVLAAKNYKRNRRKYRATVFSLFISVVLFISASSFSDYLSSSMDELIQTYNCDLSYSNKEDRELGKKIDKDEFQKLFGRLEQCGGVTQAEYHFSLWSPHITLPGKYLSSEIYRNSTGYPRPSEEKELEKEVSTSNGIIAFINDSAFEEYLRDNHMDVEKYMNADTPVGVAYDKTIVWNVEKERYTISRVFEENPGQAGLAYEVWPEDGDLENIQLIGKQTINIGEIQDNLPPGLDFESQYGVLLMYPQSAMEVIYPTSLRDDISPEYRMTFHAEDPDKTCEEMRDIMAETGDTGELYNIAETVRTNRALMTVINIFSYGFIILISLIAATNVFNTISTNVYLRRREFAMLRSVGMTQRSFYKMVNIECLFYGVKGVMFGLPVAAGITGLIWYATNSLILTSFYIPWYSVAIAVGSVFLVVFATMLYSASRIRRENVVDTLKEEDG